MLPLQGNTSFFFCIRFSHCSFLQTDTVIDYCSVVSEKRTFVAYHQEKSRHLIKKYQQENTKRLKNWPTSDLGGVESHQLFSDSHAPPIVPC